MFLETMEDNFSKHLGDNHEHMYFSHIALSLSIKT